MPSEVLYGNNRPFTMLDGSSSVMALSSGSQDKPFTFMLGTLIMATELLGTKKSLLSTP